MLKRFQIYKHKDLLLNEKEGTVHFTAVSEEALQTGLIVPHTDPLLEDNPIATIEAKSAAEAVTEYRKSLLEEPWR